MLNLTKLHLAISSLDLEHEQTFGANIEMFEMKKFIGSY